MKKFTVYLLSGALLFASVSFSGCMGSFKLTNGLYDWNKSIGSKWVNELVFFAFVFIPVYGITLTIDAIILNSIEFWGGGNPVSVIKKDGKDLYVTNGTDTFKVTRKHGRIKIEQLTGEKAGNSIDIYANIDTKSVYLKDSGQEIKIAEYVPSADGENDHYKLFKPDGEIVKLNVNNIGNLDMLKQMSEKGVLAKK